MHTTRRLASTAVLPAEMPWQPPYTSVLSLYIGVCDCYGCTALRLTNQLPCPQAQDPASYWHASGRPHFAPLEAGGPTPSQMQAYLAAELERAHVSALPVLAGCMLCTGQSRCEALLHVVQQS
jgi:hypothetical protein